MNGIFFIVLFLYTNFMVLADNKVVVLNLLIKNICKKLFKL